MEPKRVFWFGMHKVLRQTELVQLRALGYEVFSPAYLSPIYDQSADYTIDQDQPTTLPGDLFEKLINYNFFYNNISPEISDILNTYFHSAIVTISAVWLKSFLEAYNGPVIYRVYGQHFLLSEQIIELGLWEKLISRNDLTIIPFAVETLDREHQWFLSLCREIVPYQIPDDVFEHSASWGSKAHRPVITTHIPNVENPYYAAAYAAFRAQYPQRIFEITGPQRSHPQDSSFVGALPRRDFLSRLSSSSGFLYHYRDEVCYLTPIEMMEVGGPVLYAPDSLLARFFGGSTPGLITGPAVAGPKIKALLQGDNVLISEMIAAQEPVRKRYDRAIVRPAFDAAFRRILGDPRRRAPYAVRDHIVRGVQSRKNVDGTVPTVAAFLHDDMLLARSGRLPVANTPSALAITHVVKALANAEKPKRVLVTCLQRAKSLALDLFAEEVAEGRVELYPLPDTSNADLPLADRLARLDLIADLNRRDDVTAIIIPRTHSFPESLLFKGKRITYVDDYQPVPERIYAFPALRAELDELEEITIELLRASDLILTSSNFMRECLQSSSIGQQIADRLAIFPADLSDRDVIGSSFRRGTEFVSKIAGRPFLFYPAPNRPSGNYPFLLRALAAARIKHPDLMLVVTDQLGRIPGVGEVADAHDLKPHIVELDRLEAPDLDWLYRNAAALTYVSSFEGALPRAILESLRRGLPVIATNLPVIGEFLGSAADRLLLFRAGDMDEFAAALVSAFANRTEIAKAQSIVLDQVPTLPACRSAIISLLTDCRALEF